MTCFDKKILNLNFENPIITPDQLGKLPQWNSAKGHWKSAFGLPRAGSTWSGASSGLAIAITAGPHFFRVPLYHLICFLCHIFLRLNQLENLFFSVRIIMYVIYITLLPHYTYHLVFGPWPRRRALAQLTIFFVASLTNGCTSTVILFIWTE